MIQFVAYARSEGYICLRLTLAKIHQYYLKTVKTIAPPPFEIETRETRQKLRLGLLYLVVKELERFRKIWTR